MSEGNSSQAVLNVIGFMLIVVGLGLDGPISFLLLGGAVLVFLAAILLAIGRKQDTEESDAS